MKRKYLDIWIVAIWNLRERKSHLMFNETCHNNDILPKYTTINIHIYDNLLVLDLVVFLRFHSPNGTWKSVPRLIPGMIPLRSHLSVDTSVLWKNGASLVRFRSISWKWLGDIFGAAMHCGYTRYPGLFKSFPPL